MNIVVVELLVVFVPLLGIAIWEYVKVSRDLAEEDRRDEQ